MSLETILSTMSAAQETSTMCLLTNVYVTDGILEAIM